MKKTTLVILAAGLGSRYGGDIKQLAPVGPNGEIIMDYSIHDALEAGFNKVLFIIRNNLEKDFKEVIGKRIEKLCEVEYAYQELDKLPAGYRVPEGRTKPWGTGHAVLVCRELIKEPFVVINADDYYGKEAFVKAHEFLVAHAEEANSYCMAGFILKNTLSDHGTVTRGVCQVDEQNKLTDIVETYKIREHASGVHSEESGKELDPNSYVSMNMWGLQPAFLDFLVEGFKTFLDNQEPGDLKCEYLLPSIVHRLIQRGVADVTVLETQDKWFGVTYQEDRPAVEAAFAELIQKGVYKSPLNHV